MELRTEILGEGLSTEGTVLLESIARMIRDYVSEFSDELAEGAWEEHGMEGDLCDQQDLLTGEATDSAKQEVESALRRHGLEGGDPGSALASFAQALFEELCEEGESDELRQDRFQKLFSSAATLGEAEEELGRVFAQQLKEDEHALEDPSWTAIMTLRFPQKIREEIDALEIQENLESNS